MKTRFTLAIGLLACTLIGATKTECSAQALQVSSETGLITYERIIR